MRIEEAAKQKIKKNDQVMIIAGREKGKTGRVSRVVPDKGILFVEKLNIVKRHTKPTQKNQQGGIIDKEAPLNISNVMILCEKCKGPVRVGRKMIDGGKNGKSKNVRYCKSCKEVLDK